MKQADFAVGDTVKVITQDLIEHKTQKTPFEGVVISLRGQDENRTFIVRRIATGQIAVERIFALGAPNIESVKVVKKSSVRRAKLYYLRSKTNK